MLQTNSADRLREMQMKGGGTKIPKFLQASYVHADAPLLPVSGILRECPVLQFAILMYRNPKLHFL